VHELAICQSLLCEVERAAAPYGGRKVIEIVVAFGSLSGIEPQLLERAFTVARCGTIADRATLKIESIPVVVRCKACETETTVAANALLCGKCGTWQVELKSGDEMLLKRVELADITDTAGSRRKDEPCARNADAP
jgi:hydrogenase nickel incorporation protein HypA/HybF